MTEGVPRRAAFGAVAGLAGAAIVREARATPDNDVPISFACRLYDRMVPLYTGDVRIEGVRLNFMPNSDHRQVFDRMERGQEFDASELSFSDFLTLKSRNPDLPLVAIPVFSSRVFRHGSVFINTRAGIGHPRDLEGKRVGIPRWGETAVIWARGMLHDEYGLDLSKVEWVTGAVNHPGAHGSATPAARVDGFSVTPSPEGAALSAQLASGALAATISAERPNAFGMSPDVARLFPDYPALEKDWYRRTKLYPIMHVIAIRRATHDRHPWFAANLSQALTASKLRALAEMEFTGSLLYMQPWLPRDNEEWQAVFGADPWPYGVEANRPSIEAMMRYLVEQGLMDRVLPMDEVFVPVPV